MYGKLLKDTAILAASCDISSSILHKMLVISWWHSSDLKALAQDWVPKHMKTAWFMFLSQKVDKLDSVPGRDRQALDEEITKLNKDGWNAQLPSCCHWAQLESHGDHSQLPFQEISNRKQIRVAGT